MNDTTIPYDEMVQAALLSVVKNLLRDTAKNGLPGEHHFYITYRTDHSDVIIPPYLKERYPEEMTIVLQNQFWDLIVDEEHFELTLSFNRKREHLSVPFEAFLGFFDPSVDFGLHFHNADLEDDITEAEARELTSSMPHASDNAAEDDNGDNVVTLDTFRKKT